MPDPNDSNRKRGGPALTDVRSTEGKINDKENDSDNAGSFCQRSSACSLVGPNPAGRIRLAANPGARERLEKLHLIPRQALVWEATVLEARLVRRVRLERAAAVQDRAGQMEARNPTCKELRAQAARAAPARLEAVVREAEAREHEVQALPAQAADRLAVAWGVLKPVAAGAAAVEVVAEQGNKSGLFLAWTVAR